MFCIIKYNNQGKKNLLDLDLQLESSSVKIKECSTRCCFFLFPNNTPFAEFVLFYQEFVLKWNLESSYLQTKVISKFGKKKRHLL